MAIDDAGLLARLRSRDRAERERAEVELFERFEPRVRAVLARIVGAGPGPGDAVRESAALDDAVQETFVDVFRGLPRFEGRSALATWIYRVALRRGWKCAARERELRKQQVDAAALSEHPARSPVGDRLEGREMARRLAEALGQLDFDQRSVIALTAIEELTPNEIAAILGVPVGTVHSRLSRARARLRTLLKLSEV